MKKRLLKIVEDLMNLPTAPFREEAIRAYITDFCRVRGLVVRPDDMGNLIVACGGRAAGPVLAFEAHMDHPGFIVERDSVRDRTTAVFYGGVEADYFAGTGVRVYTAAGAVRGRVVGRPVDLPVRGRRVKLEVDGPVKRGDLAMWDVVPFRVKGDTLSARACDDLAGCAALLTFLDERVRSRAKGRVLALFTVAEEAGLNGALHLCVKKRIPARARIVSIETSRELPGARRGDGVVIRVGDLSNVFHHGFLRFMVHAARLAAARDGRFRFVRRLMDGGTCESAAYQAFGHVTAGVCVPLGNYHNRNFHRRRIEPERVSVSDLECMVKLFLALDREQAAMERFVKPAKPRYREERRALGERLMLKV